MLENRTVYWTWSDCLFPPCSNDFFEWTNKWLQNCHKCNRAYGPVWLRKPLKSLGNWVHGCTFGFPDSDSYDHQGSRNSLLKSADASEPQKSNHYWEPTSQNDQHFGCLSESSCIVYDLEISSGIDQNWVVKIPFSKQFLDSKTWNGHRNVTKILTKIQNDLRWSLLNTNFRVAIDPQIFGTKKYRYRYKVDKLKIWVYSEVPGAL